MALHKVPSCRLNFPLLSEVRNTFCCILRSAKQAINKNSTGQGELVYDVSGAIISRHSGKTQHLIYPRETMVYVITCRGFNCQLVTYLRLTVISATKEQMNKFPAAILLSVVSSTERPPFAFWR